MNYEFEKTDITNDEQEENMEELRSDFAGNEEGLSAEEMELQSIINAGMPVLDYIPDFVKEDLKENNVLKQYCLLLKGINKEDKLSDSQEQALEALKDYVHSIYEADVDPYEVNTDACYLYATLAEEGIAEEEKDFTDNLYKTILYLSLECEYPDYIFDDYPLAERYLDDMIPELDARILQDLYYYYSEHGEDEKAFICVNTGRNAYPSGLCGGMALVSTMFYISECTRLTGECYLRGKGVEKDYPRALALFRMYRTDHLLQKHCEDYLEESTLSELFQKMEEESAAGINYPGLHYSLAVMYREGIGTAYNYDKYLECIRIEEGDYTFQFYLNGMEEYTETRIGEDVEHNGYSNVKEWDDKDIQKRDIVRFGKYNHRDVLWRVLDVQDDKALLLSTDCLESSYVCEDQGDDSMYSGSSIQNWLKYTFPDSLCRVYCESAGEDEYQDVDKYTGFSYEDVLVPDEDGCYSMLLKKEYFDLLQDEDKCPGARIQAQINAYEDCGVEVDEVGTAAWWTAVDWTNADDLLECEEDTDDVVISIDDIDVTTLYGEEEEERAALPEGTVVYCDCDGCLSYGDMRWVKIGIRPVVWLKLNK